MVGRVLPADQTKGRPFDIPTETVCPHIFAVPQNLYEFWAVATRKRGGPPAGQNGLGMTPKQASQWLQFFQRRFVFLSDREELFTSWHALVRS